MTAKVNNKLQKQKSLNQAFNAIVSHYFQQTTKNFIPLKQFYRFSANLNFLFAI